jgi:hypothetical protein
MMTLVWLVGIPVLLIAWQDYFTRFNSPLHYLRIFSVKEKASWAIQKGSIFFLDSPKGETKKELSTFQTALFIG